MTTHLNFSIEFIEWLEKIKMNENAQKMAILYPHSTLEDFTSRQKASRLAMKHNIKLIADGKEKFKEELELFQRVQRLLQTDFTHTF